MKKFQIKSFNQDKKFIVYVIKKGINKKFINIKLIYYFLNLSFHVKSNLIVIIIMN